MRNKSKSLFIRSSAPVPGGAVLPYISHLVRYVPQGMHFAHFGLAWNRVWFSRELQECVSVFIVLIPNK